MAPHINYNLHLIGLRLINECKKHFRSSKTSFTKKKEKKIHFLLPRMQIGPWSSTFSTDLAQLEEKVPSADSGTAVTVPPET